MFKRADNCLLTSVIIVLNFVRGGGGAIAVENGDPVASFSVWTSLRSPATDTVRGLAEAAEWPLNFRVRFRVDLEFEWFGICIHPRLGFPVTHTALSYLGML